jgi:hypothetical protein
MSVVFKENSTGSLKWTNENPNKISGKVIVVDIS